MLLLWPARAAQERRALARRADDSPRPPSRHKPPPQALFLEVPAGSSSGARKADDLVLSSPGAVSPGRAFAYKVTGKPSLSGSSSTGGIAMKSSKSA